MGISYSYLYTLIFGDAGTWGQHIRIYTWGWGYTIHPIHSQSWGHGDVGTALLDKHMGTGIAGIYSIHSLFWGRGDSTQGYTYGGRNNTINPIHLAHSWGRGDVGYTSICCQPLKY